MTERRIIPTTWRENGVGVLGSVGPFAYRAYLLNGLDATGFSPEGLRGGRQKGSRALASDFGFAGRFDMTPTPGMVVGVGLFTGGADHGQLSLDGRTLGVGTTIVELHGQAQVRGFDLRALYARATLGDVAALNAALGFDGKESPTRCRVATCRLATTSCPSSAEGSASHPTTAGSA